MKKISDKVSVSIHYSFIILMVSAFFIGVGKLILLYFICLVLHELVHALVAKKLGYKIGKIKLLATGAVLEAESDEFSFQDEILISLSAPTFNLCVSIILLGIWWIYPEVYNYTQDLLVINLAIFAFNILPIFPLDGGRVLLACLSKRNNRKTSVLITKFVAMLLSLFIFILFILSLFSSANFSLGVVSITLFVGAIAEDKKAVYKRILFLERKRIRSKTTGVEIRYIMVDEYINKAKLLKLINARFYTIFLLVDDNFCVKKQISEYDILKK